MSLLKEIMTDFVEGQKAAIILSDTLTNTCPVCHQVKENHRSALNCCVKKES